MDCDELDSRQALFFQLRSTFTHYDPPLGHLNDESPRLGHVRLVRPSTCGITRDCAQRFDRVRPGAPQSETVRHPLVPVVALAFRGLLGAG